MWTKIVRHRLVFLVGVLVTAVVLAVLEQAENRVVSMACTILLGLLWLGLPLASLAALNARQPESFLVRAGTFTTPPSASVVLSTGMFTVLPLALAAEAADDARRGSGPDWFQIVVLVMMLLLLPLLWCRVLGPFGVALRPDGVLDRQPFGSVFVPWEAGPAAAPTSQGVKLRLARPDLVVRRGLRRGTTVSTGADRGFTAWAINLYAARPDCRPAIGTDDGLQQLKILLAAATQ